MTVYPPSAVRTLALHAQGDRPVRQTGFPLSRSTSLILRMANLSWLIATSWLLQSVARLFLGRTSAFPFSSLTPKWSTCSELGGRHAPFWVVDILRFQWPPCSVLCNYIL
jgi:hypothetical protein